MCWHCRFCVRCFDTYRDYIEHFRDPKAQRLIFTSCH
jgi:hypothetical protein